MKSKQYNYTANDYTIRIPLDMFHFTQLDGKTWPVAFKWPDADGVNMDVNIDKIISVTPEAEQKSGTVGDRYECEIEGKIVYIYYSKLAPRKWFKIIPCTELEYNSYYRLRGEQPLMVAESRVRYEAQNTDTYSESAD
jgi:hypothetical protein